MICDKHCPLLDKATGVCKNENSCELREKGSICGDCVHDEVCGLEGHLDPAMTFCADMTTTSPSCRVGSIERPTTLTVNSSGSS